MKDPSAPFSTPREDDMTKGFVRKLAVGWMALVVMPGAASAARQTDAAALDALARQFDGLRAARETALYLELTSRRDGPMGRLNRDERLQLVFIDDRGMPRFYLTHNLNAARTVGTDEVWPGGATGFALDGTGTTLGELSEWDGGGVRTTHLEFQGRVVQMDVPEGLSNHATHVAGTLVAAGLNANARGMSYAGSLAAYDWHDDGGEMATAAAVGMHVSNHSYGFATGWLFNWDGSGEWFWFGDTTVSGTEDYGFGFYSGAAQAWDAIAFNAPYYLIVKSAGNDRNDFGPSSQPDSHYVWAEDLDDWVWSTTVRDADGGVDGYDTVSWMGNAKNILTVGSVLDIVGGWTSPNDVNVNDFSGWGPTDDGRIKPDIVANGNSLTSTTAVSNTSYGNASGTSMSGPNAAGSINLLVQQYEASHAGSAPRSATLKALVFHTADEAGTSPGPDYEHGWGLLNVDGAATLIDADSADIIREETLLDGQSETYMLQHLGGDLRVTMAWTDPPGTPPAPSVNPGDAMLVNDLDLRVEEVATTTVHLPWMLDPSNPSNPATTGDNVRDNAEQVFVAAAPAGAYTVTVSHKGALSGGSQDFSIVADVELGPDGTVSVPTPQPSLRLLGNYPNPFTHTTTVQLDLPLRARVVLGVYDLGGRRVRELANAVWTPGRHAVSWDGRNDRGERLDPGVYFLRADAAGETRTDRLILLD